MFEFLVNLELCYHHHSPVYIFLIKNNSSWALPLPHPIASSWGVEGSWVAQRAVRGRRGSWGQNVDYQSI